MNLSGPVVHYPSIGSTQDEARKALKGVHWTTDQTAGRGRFDRRWHAEAGQSVAISICFPEYKGFAKPYLISMWMCLGIAEEFGLRIQWPNDLILNGKKVSGVLTEVIEGVPIVGIGLNIGPMSFPAEIALRATSFANEGHIVISAEQAFERLLTCLRSLPPVPMSWPEMEMKWMQFDNTPGKLFKLHDGHVGVAQSISGEGELLVDVNGVMVTVPYAEALWGPNAQ